jgi:hypothetical protein
MKYLAVLYTKTLAKRFWPLLQALHSLVGKQSLGALILALSRSNCERSSGVFPLVLRLFATFTRQAPRLILLGWSYWQLCSALRVMSAAIRTLPHVGRFYRATVLIYHHLCCCGDSLSSCIVSSFLRICSYINPHFAATIALYTTRIAFLTLACGTFNFALRTS